MTVTSEIPGSAHEGSDISMDNYAFLQRFIHQESGIVIDAGKHYLLESRLVPILRQEGLSSLNELCVLLRATSSPPVRRQVVEALTNETLFFRDAMIFEALQRNIFPEMIRLRAQSKTLRIWSAASSSG